MNLKTQNRRYSNYYWRVAHPSGPRTSLNQIWVPRSSPVLARAGPSRPQAALVTDSFLADNYSRHVPRRLKRHQETRDLHFIIFSSYQRRPLLACPQAMHWFEVALELSRRRYDFYVIGYVVMPEHVHLLISEPERGTLASAIQAMKQSVARRLVGDSQHFWQARYYDFNVWTVRKRVEKLRYIHRNPVKRGLAEKPEDWRWSSFRNYATGEEGVVKIESPSTGRKRKRGKGATGESYDANNVGRVTAPP